MRISRILKLTAHQSNFKAYEGPSHGACGAFHVAASVDVDVVRKIFIHVVLVCSHADRHVVGSVLVLLQGMTDYPQENAEFIPQDEYEFIAMNFGSLLSSILLLFQLGTGGGEWTYVFQVLGNAGVLYQVIFCLYVIFYTFGMFNILTGMVIENVMCEADEDDNAKVFEYRRQQKARMQQLMSLFQQLDVDGDGRLSREEFTVASSQIWFRSLMADIELEVRDADLFFNMLASVSEDGMVCIDTFIDGCMHVTGPAAALDFQILHCECRRIVEVPIRTYNATSAIKTGEQANERILAEVREVLSNLQGVQMREMSERIVGPQIYAPEPTDVSRISSVALHLSPEFNVIENADDIPLNSTHALRQRI